MNRCDLIDSNYALDGLSRRRDNGSMTDKGDPASHKLQMLVLERRDASVNMARFYVLAVLLSNISAGANRRRMLICRATVPAV